MSKLVYMDTQVRPCSRCGGVRDGAHQSYCKACYTAYMKEHREKNREAYNAAQRRYYQNHGPEVRAMMSDRMYESKLRNQYGLTVEDVQRLFASQSGLCAICKREIFLRKKNAADSAALDHNHDTGQVRGLLCGNCNKALGQFYEDPVLLRAAATYIESWAEEVQAQEGAEEPSPPQSV